MADEPKKKRIKGWYSQIGLSQQTFEKLEKLRTKKVREIGMKLSWNEFFTLHLREHELAEAKR